VDDLDAVLMAARRDGYLTIDVPVELLARTAHQCRRSRDLARKADFRDTIRTMANNSRPESSRSLLWESP
jgi:hypothetical protein